MESKDGEQGQELEEEHGEEARSEDAEGEAANEAREEVAGHLVQAPIRSPADRVRPGRNRRSVTRGGWDLRGTARAIPWPNLQQKHCLDVGTADGFWAFEMERRGAAEVVATDLPSPFQGRARARFEHARKRLGSDARYEARRLRARGEFDVVFAGYVLQMVRDPIGALCAMHRACRGHREEGERVAARWVFRFLREDAGVTLGGVQAVVACLAALCGPRHDEALLARSRHGRRGRYRSPEARRRVNGGLTRPAFGLRVAGMFLLLLLG